MVMGFDLKPEMAREHILAGADFQPVLEGYLLVENQGVNEAQSWGVTIFINHIVNSAVCNRLQVLFQIGIKPQNTMLHRVHNNIIIAHKFY